MEEPQTQTQLAVEQDKMEGVVVAPMTPTKEPESTPTLTAGFTLSVLSGASKDETSLEAGSHVRLQVVALKTLTDATGSERYRTAMSDGVYVLNCNVGLFPTAANSLFAANEIVKGSVVQVTTFTVVNISGTLMCQIGEFAIVQKEAATIGSPIVYKAQEANKEANTPMNAAYPTPNTTPDRPQTGPTSSPTSSAGSDVFPIQGLNPYQYRWSIKARVTNKSEKRNYKSGEGKLFSIDLADESGEIKATAFGDNVDKFFDLFEKNKVYVISRGQVRTSNKKFSTLRNDYEIHLDQNTVVTRCDEEDTMAVPKVFYNFVAIDLIEKIQKDSHVDIVGVIKEVSEVTSIAPKSDPSKKMNKRELKVSDMSLKEVTVTVWNDLTSQFSSASVGLVVAFKGLRVSDYNNRSLSTGFSTVVAISPEDVPEAKAIQKWYSNGGSLSHTTSISVRSSPGKENDVMSLRSSLKQVQLDSSPSDETAKYFTVRAMITHVPRDDKRSIMYPGEPGTGAKLVQQPDQQWLCEKSQKLYAQPDYRFNLRFFMTDFSTGFYSSTFHDDGCLLMGTTPAELMSLKDSNPKAYESAFVKPLFKQYTFRVRAKGDTYNGETRMVYSCSNAKPVEYKEESNVILRMIRAYGL